MTYSPSSKAEPPQSSGIELICVRHGRTAWNAEKRFQGQTDIPLDDEGRAQAAALGALLREERFAFALSSDLSRCAQTAGAILAARPDVELRLERDLREMGFGDWEGLTWAQIIAADPSLARDGFYDPLHYRPPGGETFDLVVERARRVVDRLRAGCRDGERILLVTHAGVLHALLRVVLGESGAKALAVRFSPASVTRFVLERDAGGRLVRLNEVPEQPS